MTNEKQIFDINICKSSITPYLTHLYTNIKAVAKQRKPYSELEDYEKVSEIDTYISSKHMTLGALNNKFVVDNVLYNKNKLFIGDVQLGKTNILLDSAILRMYLEDKNMFICVNGQNKDLKQFQSRFEIKLMESGIMEQFLNDIYMCFPNTVHNKKQLLKLFINAMVIKVKASMDLFEKLEESEFPKLVLGISHKNVLNKVIKYFGRLGCISKFGISVDESDLVSAHDSTDIHNNSGRADAFRRLFNKADSVDRITATMNAHCIRDDFPVYCRDVHSLPLNTDYVSFGHSKYKINELKFSLSIRSPIFHSCQQEQFTKIMDNLHCTMPSAVVTWNITRRKDCHEFLKDSIQKLYVNDIVVIINNGSNMIYYSEEYSGIKAKDIASRKRLSLQDNLRLLKNETKDTPTMIHLVGSMMINRGQSMRTEVPHYSSYKDILYSNVLVYDTTTRRTADELIQGINRISGVFKKQDEFFQGLHLYSTKNIIRDVKEFINWKHESLINIAKPENKGLNFNAVVSSFTHAPKRKLAYKHKIYHKTKTNLFFANQPSLRLQEIRKPKINTNDDEITREFGLGKRATTIRSVYNILLSNSDKWMSARDVLDYKTDWNMKTKTPTASIQRNLLQLSKNRNISIIREKRHVYYYKYITNE